MVKRQLERLGDAVRAAAVRAQKGATIFAPRGIPHTYRYLGQAGSFSGGE
jgi:hypothetical protein